MSREVLAPPLLRMGANRCYRVNLVHEDFSGQQGASMRAQQGQSSSKSYAEEDLYGDDYNDDVDDEVDCLIEETNNGMFKLSMHVASSFYGGIIGHKGSTKRRIETEAQCDITIPQRNTTQKNSDSKIIIRGKTRNNVVSARRKIQLLLASLRKRMRPTHFYGVALNFGEVKEKFKDLKAQIMAAGIPGIEESIFQTESGIHLTIGTCVLMDDIERSKAVEVLQSCREFLKDLEPPFTVRVSGLEIMNDDPSSVRVLYALVDSPDLQIFADRCFTRFNQSGLGFDDYDRGNVKLHMTVMNNRYRDSDAKSFDAREILKRWNDIQLLFSGEHQFTDVLERVINFLMSDISDWMSSCNLCVNSAKTKAMIFKSPRYDVNLDIMVNGDKIEFVECIKCLGVLIDSRLNFDQHINWLCSTINFTLRRLYSLNLYLPVYIKKRIAHALLMSNMLYCAEVFTGVKGRVMRRYNLLFNRIIRFIYNLRYRDHVSDYVVDFLGSNFKSFIHARLLIHFYKVFRAKCPEYLLEFFILSGSLRNPQLNYPLYNTSILQRSFQYRVAKIWNSLPLLLRSFDFSVNVFKAKLKEYAYCNNL